MLEGDELARRHFAASGRAIVLEHVFQGVPNKREIVGRKPGALGELRRNETMRSSSPEASSYLFFSASLVAAMRVIEISSGTIDSNDRAKESCTGPRTCP